MEPLAHFFLDVDTLMLGAFLTAVFRGVAAATGAVATVVAAVLVGVACAVAGATIPARISEPVSAAMVRVGRRLRVVPGFRACSGATRCVRVMVIPRTPVR